MRGGWVFGRGMIGREILRRGALLNAMQLDRASGILLHPSSLPNGVLDEHAFAFVDWLAAAGQRWWQVLPLGPTDETGSPYMSPSAFAGSPNLVADPARKVGDAERRAFCERDAELDRD